MSTTAVLTSYTRGCMSSEDLTTEPGRKIPYPNSNQGQAAKGPAWGLKEQLKSRGNGSTPRKEIKIQLPHGGAILADKIKQHFRDNSKSRREALGCCAQDIDRALAVLVQRVKTRLIKTVDKMDIQLQTLESNMRRLCEATEARGLRMLREAKRTADSEREEKAILCQWLNGFLVGASRKPTLSSMDFTFARFALNMAMASSRTHPEVMLHAGAPAFLVGMLSSENELVTGPAALALSQMAHHEACRRALGVAGGIPPLVLLAFTSQSPAVLTQVCISLALLSQYPPNKAIVAGRGGIAAMVRLLEGFRKEKRVTVQVVGQALAALVNLMYESAANRGLAEECGLTLPIITIMDAVDNEFVLVQASLALANVAFGNEYTALRLLEAGADEALCNLVKDSDKSRHSDVMEAAFIALANLANNALNQAHVGAGSAIELAVTVCKHCESPRVVRAAALALCSLCLKSHANKTKCAALDAVPILLELGSTWGLAEEGEGGSSLHSRGASETTAAEEVSAAAQAICCVAILMQHATNVLVMKKISGLKQLADLIQDCEENEVIIAAAKAVVILIPEPNAIVRTAKNHRVSEEEEAGAHEALVRVKEWVFGRKAPPSWLLYGLDLLGCDVDAIEARLQADGEGAFRKPSEYFVRSDFFQERETNIPPDVTVAEDEDLGGMLFHVF